MYVRPGNEHRTTQNKGSLMDFTSVDGVLHIHLDNFFILGIACLCYFLGRWIKEPLHKRWVICYN